ncbi:MAG: hypothetical protein QGG64_24560 [Candidatus Latescibacteria bacterium]|nr:hypothetical protein [Candidatus Latescibacterota bacterium]
MKEQPKQGVGQEMLSSNTKIQSIVRDFRMDQMMRYNLFVPRLYNLCRSLGFEVGNIMPSRAFCVDENQGFPVMLIAKHFGVFPFNHGRAGGTVATDRHGPHAHHGNDMVIIQASHVGYDPETETFGSYCRLQTPDNKKTTTCGKVGGVIQWYQDAYRFAQENIYLGRDGDVCTITIDNHLLDEGRTEGLFLNLDRMVMMENGKRILQRTLSTSHVFVASDDFCESLSDHVWPVGERVAIGSHLGPEMFLYWRHIPVEIEGHNHLEDNLINAMPWIVTSSAPFLVAAQINTQAEFDRTFRSIVKEREYQGKRLLFISCLNIDISPQEGQMFPLTRCVPWAAYIQDGDGNFRTLEQAEIFELLMQQSVENPDQIDLEAAIQKMVDASEIKITL